MTKRKTRPDLGKLADDANKALSDLVAEGYEKEVQTIRTFLIENGEHHKRLMRLQHQIAGKLVRDLRSKRGEDEGDNQPET